MDKDQLLSQFFPLIVIVSAIGVGSWVLTTWMRIKHGYPLDGAWGQAVYPKSSDETIERIRMASVENAQLRAELAAVKD